MRPYSVRMTPVRKYDYNSLPRPSAQAEKNISETATNEEEGSTHATEKEAEDEEKGEAMDTESTKGEDDKKGGKRKREANKKNGNKRKPRGLQIPFTTQQVLLTQPVSDIRGHTSFLTFAKKCVE